MKIPEGLVLGAATAAYQIEGAVDEGGRGVSIWDEFAHTPGRIKDGETGDVADDHYHRLDQDLDLMQELGIDAYRFSIAWPRIVPEGRGTVNQEGIDFYSRLVDGLLDRGIKPVATVYHWDLPAALEVEGGWAVRSAASAMADYAEVIGKALGDRVAMWTTLNEPWGSAYLGYAAGKHAPGRTDAVDAFRAVHHLNLAHGLSAQALRGVIPSDAEVSVTLNLHSFRPVGPSGDAARAKLLAIANDAFLSPMLEGRLSDELLDATSRITDWAFVEPGDLREIHQPIDVLGVNYYYTNAVRMLEPGDDPSLAAGAQWPGAADTAFLPTAGPHTEMGWNVDPAGLTELLLGLRDRFPGLPLAITENGAALVDVVEGGRVRDQGRIDYVRRHLEAMLDAVHQGADVRSYYLWSLMDNFEWSLGFTKRFGLIHVDYSTQERIIKDSGLWYRDVITERRTDVDLPG